MKFTIALTFFAAASALELKADDSERMALLNTATTAIIPECLSIALDFMLEMV